MNEKIENFNKLRWSLIAIYFVVNILLIFTYKNPNLLAIDSFLVTAILFILAILHGYKRYGKNIAVFFIITWIVSFSLENLSIATGFPFGFYHYSPTLGLLTVPLIITLNGCADSAPLVPTAFRSDTQKGWSLVYFSLDVAVGATRELQAGCFYCATGKETKQGNTDVSDVEIGPRADNTCSVPVQVSVKGRRE